MKANLIEVMPDIAGCYLLTASGSLGCYDERRAFHIDAALSQALAGFVSAFIRNYVHTRETTGWRIGVVHPDHQEKPWQSATLALENPVLRQLYPVHTTQADELTVFQQRNREKSLYRGMDLLLSHADQPGQAVPSFCPVLMYRGVSLRQFLPTVGRRPRDAEAEWPVLEVINLVAGAELSERCQPGVESLVRKLRRNLIKPERRRIPNLVLIDDVRAPTGSASAGAPAAVSVIERHSQRFPAGV